MLIIVSSGKFFLFFLKIINSGRNSTAPTSFSYNSTSCDFNSMTASSWKFSNGFVRLITKRSFSAVTYFFLVLFWFEFTLVGLTPCVSMFCILSNTGLAVLIEFSFEIWPVWGIRGFVALTFSVFSKLIHCCRGSVGRLEFLSSNVESSFSELDFLNSIELIDAGRFKLSARDETRCCVFWIGLS